jgi:hypothetical protein
MFQTSVSDPFLQEKLLKVNYQPYQSTVYSIEVKNCDAKEMTTILEENLEPGTYVSIETK